MLGNRKLLILAAAMMIAPATRGAVIYQDDFSGGAVDLDGTAPDVGVNNWVAQENFNADGSIVNDYTGASFPGGSATLAFTPVDGLVYTLDASFTEVAGDGNWLALGFAEGQSADTASNNRFLNGLTTGKAWMFHRGDATLQTNNAFLGIADGNASPGNRDGAAFSPAFNGGGPIDLRVVLDTTGGGGNWTATWFAKLPTSTTYTEVRPEATLLDETITSVGLAKSNDGVTGNVTFFRLSAVPEPSSLAVLLLGLTAGAFGRFRR